MNVITFFKCKKKAQQILLGFIMFSELLAIFYFLNHQKNNYAKIKRMQKQIEQLTQIKESKHKKLSTAITEKELLTCNRFHQEKVARNKLFLIKKEQFLLITSSVKI